MTAIYIWKVFDLMEDLTEKNRQSVVGSQLLALFSQNFDIFEGND